MQVIKGILLCLLVVCCVYIDLKPLDLSEHTNKKIRIYVKGAVKQEKEIIAQPYTMFHEVIDKLDVSSDSDLSVFNPYTILNDGDVLCIPYKKEEGQLRININTAKKEELLQLKGVGESTADAIISYRNEVGLFQCIEDLMNVKGIGPAKFEKIKDEITI